MGRLQRIFQISDALCLGVGRLSLRYHSNRTSTSEYAHPPFVVLRWHREAIDVFFRATDTAFIVSF